MLDRKRIAAKIDELDTYIDRIEKIAPHTFEEYEESIEKKMACERILQISIECIMDIIHLLVKGMKLGVPGDEESMIDSLTKKGVFTKELAKTLKTMKGFRNVLVHRYGEIEDERVFEAISAKLNDFEEFKEAVMKVI